MVRKLINKSMKIIGIKQKTLLSLTIASNLALPVCKSQAPDKLPNILWIVSEDNSAYFTVCYGNSFATTPNIDKLAS
jgi:N-sulfoglucosamine sulfohydrolase